MTTIKTERTEYAVRFISSHGGEAITIHMDDVRKVSAIAAEFEGIEHFTAVSSVRPDRVFEYDGYSVLKAVERYKDGSVMIRLAREGD